MTKRKIKRMFKIGFRVGVIIGVVFFSAFMIIKATHATYLLSPGHLSGVNTAGVTVGGEESHADFERECSHCHAPIHCVQDTKCQDCHFDIEEQRIDTTALHGRLPSVSKCQDCHPEHQGAEADLTDLPYLNIDHYKLTGFSLDTHQTNYDGSTMDCESCHQQNVDIMETMDCTSCHAAQDHDFTASHIEKYGTGCFECHDGTDRMVNGFYHTAVFAQEGGHQGLECIQCHTEKQYVGQASDCQDCHTPPDHHTGVFDAECIACHDVYAFKPAFLRYHVFDLGMGNEPTEDCQRCHIKNYGDTPCENCHLYQETMVHVGHEETADLHDCLACHATGRAEDAVITQLEAQAAQEGSGGDSGQGGNAEGGPNDSGHTQNGQGQGASDEDSETERQRPWWWIFPLP